MRLVRVNELPSTINREIPLDEEILKKSKLSYMLILQYQDSTNVVGLHALIKIQTGEGAEILTEGATFIAEISDWGNWGHTKEDLLGKAPVVNLVDYAMAFVCGMIYRHTSGTALNTLNLPLMDTSELLKGLKVEKVSGKKQD